ncbi:Transcriptional regulator, TetR family [[Actinomadura] parvosata subsp. kistnae]|uniref:TetR family transcriptional regulator n=1 Tax=[Actinomadura] parvosata subsp. kistnae TaxID=1909395 RepID=A0A1V0AJ03_9ACTN|nr:TetR/AcrR family transcriptional regulator [Nonomuraea sp. ATCC 55076]AQZ70072.1 TetR family transcriptional regulator [Nonomuraea sp. ATCC 55076]SPL90838.1 Transcriptional regulator, TetR family [Actinomadura parvosata subsp. kistnae]
MAATRDQIMKAAIQHLNESPAASMAQLAEAVGISRATLHRHFSSRDDLMLALAHRAHDQWEDLQTSSGMVAATASQDRAALERALKALLEGLIEVADEYGFGLTDDRLATHPELKRRADELEEREVVFYAAAQRAGLLRADLPARWISNTVFGLLVAVRESLRNGDVARRDVARLLLDTFLHGAAPEKERA